ncbi:hypothetical protein [Sulfuricurvum sp.]|uniref:hypothetical protein n=1 Tax=Sulfuricurvum sp. TaxID=2025608 RepID=UPI003BB4E5C8
MQKKSQGVSFILTLIFGPVGIIYSSVTTALIMFVAYIVILMMSMATDSFGFGLLLATIGSIVAGVFSVTSYNENLEVEEKKQKEMHEEMIKKAIEDNKQKEFIQKQMIEEAVQARLKDMDKKSNDLSEPLPGWMDDGLPLENEIKN